ncbi:hypothetical protein BBF96_10335 [Anoxybacter fermentans]|uniref:ABC transporter permease n=1 Tax=Anoxybacter fermentans TaxID=1323375 RepID=A0A3S9SZP2_9FIRM|nr:ABC-2 family transporter protein [Anoxybacter fermentans]AZR73747.1 hypothetical protein BBF96_10335 [Anoxybacter fermentans]
MRKYIALFLIKIRNLLQYRLNFFLTLLSGILPLFALFFLWKEIYSKHSIINGMSFNQIFTYYILAYLLSTLLHSEISWVVSEEIRDGKINSHVLKPIKYMWLHLSFHLSDKVVLITLILIIFSMMFIFLPGLLLPVFSILNLLIFLISLFLASIMGFYFSFLLGLIAFWWEHTEGLFYFQALVLQLFSGSIIPLDWYPGQLKYLLQFTPFSYMVYFPIKIYLGQVTTVNLAQHFVVLLMWILIFHLICKLIWKKGIRIYRAIGG